MKNLLLPLSIVALSVTLGCSNDDSMETTTVVQNDEDPIVAFTNIPDPVFEQNLIDLGYDDQLDGVVRTSSISLVTDLVLNEKGISDVTGLSDFSSLSNLWLNDNELTTINVSQNTNLKFCYVAGNNLSSINVTNLNSLEKLGINNNMISTLDVSNNLELQILQAGNNELSAIDVSNNNALTIFSVVDNPLNCIKVNANQLNDIPEQWQKDDEDSYSLNCN